MKSTSGFGKVPSKHEVSLGFVVLMQNQKSHSDRLFSEGQANCSKIIPYQLLRTKVMFSTKFYFYFNFIFENCTF